MVIFSMLLMMLILLVVVVFIIVGGVWVLAGLGSWAWGIIACIRKKGNVVTAFIVGAIFVVVGVAMIALPEVALFLFGGLGRTLRNADLNKYENQKIVSEYGEWKDGFEIGEKYLIPVDGLIQNRKLDKETYGIIIYKDEDKNKKVDYKVYQVKSASGNLLYFVEQDSAVYCEQEDYYQVISYYMDPSSYRGQLSRKEGNGQWQDKSIELSVNELKDIRALYDWKASDFVSDVDTQYVEVTIRAQTEDRMAVEDVELLICGEHFVLIKSVSGTKYTGIYLEDYQEDIVNEWLKEAGY